MKEGVMHTGSRKLRTSSCPGPFHSSFRQLGTSDTPNAKGAQNTGEDTGGYISAYWEGF